MWPSGFVLFLATAVAKDSKDASLAALSQTVQQQAAKITALESKLGKLSGKSCDAYDDPEPELAPFRAFERQKRAEKIQEDLQLQFTTIVRARQRECIFFSPHHNYDAA